MKQLKDYLHLLIGCDVQYPNSEGKIIVAQLTGFSILDGAETTYKRKRNGCNGDLLGFKDGKERGHECYVENIKPILRPLSSMTEEESEEYSKIIFEKSVVIDKRKMTARELGIYHTQRDAAGFYYLLSKHFDLFGLIEAGLAIDATTLKPA